jgi:hypothetical protein
VASNATSRENSSTRDFRGTLYILIISQPPSPFEEYYTCPEIEYQYYFEKTKKFPKKHLHFAAMSAIIFKRLFRA